MNRIFDYWIPCWMATGVAFLFFKYAGISGQEKMYQDFIKSFVEFGSLCFGVLLTFFGIIIQSSSETIRRMKRSTKILIV